MARYDYGYRPGYTTGKGSRPDVNEWSKTSYADDECRTVIVEADGTQRIIIGCTPLHKPGSYVTKTETIVHERVVSPEFPDAYKHSSPPKTFEPVKEYGRYAGDKWPVKSYGYAADDQPSSPVKGYGYASDDHKLRRPSSPVKGYGYAADDHKLRRPSSPVKSYGYASDDHKVRRPSSPEYDYPREIGDLLSKVQIEASRDQPSRIGPFNGVNRRQPTGQPAGYGDYNNKILYKPNGNTIRSEIYDDYHPKNDRDMRPNMILSGNHQARPIPSTWVPPPGRDKSKLSSATDDMEAALRFLKESANSSSATTTMPQYSNSSAVPKQDEYSRPNAEQRRVRFNEPSWS